MNFGGFMGSAGIVNYYILCRGEGNILHVYRPPEEYNSVMCHPDRLSVPKTPETEAIIMEQQKRYDFPTISFPITWADGHIE